MRWFLRVNLTGKSVGNYSEITSEFVPSFLKKELSRAEISVWLEGVTSLGQKFTKVKRPQTNGKAERVIRTLMEMWHQKTEFTSREHRNLELIRFINFYNTVKPHKGIDGKTPYEKLLEYFDPKTKNTTT